MTLVNLKSWGLCRLPLKTSPPPLYHQCRSELPPLPGWSWLATIAELMGLIRLFSFPSAGSIDPVCNHPCYHSPLLSLTQSHISPGHTPVGPPGSIHFMPFTPQATNLSLSFLCHLSLCTLSRSAWCTLSHLQHLWCQFLSAGALFVFPPSAPPFISVFPPFFLLSCFFCSSLSFIASSFLSCTNPHILFTLPLSFQIPQCALLARCVIHCHRISHGWGVAPHSNII